MIMSEKILPILYRYEMLVTGSGDDKLSRYCRNVVVIERIYYISRKTKCGYWIHDKMFCDQRWIRKKAKKPFACLEKIEALKVFINRKTSHIRILKNNIQDIQEAIRIVTEQLNK